MSGSPHPLLRPQGGVVSVVQNERVKNVICPHCGGRKIMPNVVEHTRDARPYLCLGLTCGKSFAKGLQ